MATAQDQRKPHLVNLLAGGMSGMAVDMALFPLDTLKTVLQSRHSAQAKSLNFRAMYRGVLSAALGSFPSAATFWVFYEGSKKHLADATGGEYMPAVHAGAAMMADVAVVGVRNPFEVVKQQMQVGMHRSTRQAVTSILKVEGLGGFYAGYFSTLVREMPFDAVQFLLYEEIKQRYKEYKQEPLVMWENSLLGSCAGAVAAAATTPLDMAKTRLMTQMGEADKYKGVADVLKRVYRQEGAAALFAGIRPRVAWISFGGAIFIGTFEELKRRFSVLADV